MYFRGWFVLMVVISLAGLLGAPRDGLTASPSRSVLAVIQGAERVEFTLDALEELDQARITTRTPWHAEPRTYEGPFLAKVVEAAGFQGKDLVVSALNDYQATIPMSEARTYGVVLATRVDGRRMSVREYGPLFIMYPLDDNPELKTDRHYARCVWQVSSIEIQ